MDGELVEEGVLGGGKFHRTSGEGHAAVGVVDGQRAGVEG